MTLFWRHIGTSAVRGRIAFDVFTCYDAAQLKHRTHCKIRKYGDAVAAAGDTFVAPAFTTTGCPYPSALSFFRMLAHTGDSVPSSAGRDIRKFESEAATWLTSTHTSFMIHAAAVAAARACAIAVKKYCLRRLADDYIMRATDGAPTPVPWPM